jgi:hypothetical protein
MRETLFGVAKKTRHKGEIFRLASNLLRECRTAWCSAPVFLQAGPRRQKSFAIGKRDGERSANGGGTTVVARVAGGKG